MKKKQFKAESKKLLDLMINSIYTNKEIFLRELVSNASDAIDKIYFKSLTDNSLKVDKDKLEIKIDVNEKKRLLTITDNGCGMTKEELENNLGTIAESGSGLFKEENKTKDVNIIGQFGVGFYSVFMVADKVEVHSKSYLSNESYVWSSEGIDGYTIEEDTKKDNGTEIIITIKEDTEDYNYGQFLEQYKIEELVKKYSNYITYPIKMKQTHRHLKEESKDEYEEHTEIETLNSMTPIWKKNKSEIKDEDYDAFYASCFNDYEKPLHTIHYNVEGTTCSYDSLLFIPSHAPYDLYAKEYQKGLQLYSNGVLIMDKCSDLLPDYFGFVKGLVDSSDLSLNISREILQQDKQLSIMAKNIEKKIIKELSSLEENDREKYDKFYKEFGLQLKLGIYNSYGMKKDELQDLLLFYSSTEEKMVTLKEYVSRLKENQDKIYYAVGETVDKIDLMPQVESVKEKSYEILYLTEYADEFVIQLLQNYDNKEFMSVSNADLDLDSKEDKDKIKELNKTDEKILDKIKSVLGDKVSHVKFTNNLKNHPVCLTTEGNISTGMEKVMDAMPVDQKVKASTILSINANHPIAKKLEDIYANHPEDIEVYSKILYSQARLIEGMSIDNPNEISDLICDILSK